MEIMEFEHYGFIFCFVMFVLSLLVFPTGIDMAVLQSENPYKEQLGKYAHQINDLIIVFSGIGLFAISGFLITDYKNSLKKHKLETEKQ